MEGLAGVCTLTLALCRRGSGDIMGRGLGVGASFDCERLRSLFGSPDGCDAPASQNGNSRVGYAPQPAD